MKEHQFSIILFDGVCNLCNGSVNFIIDYDKANSFKFASLQSEKGKTLLKKYQLDLQLNSIVLIENGKAFQKSTAALRISKKLSFPFFLLSFFLFTPRSIRDFAYDMIAKNRYAWFGKSDSCRIPTPELQTKFI
ncbi:MAG: DCC1-like thiol-disulfide oxidoreductase family protein [Bacteroidota bacterium]